MTANECKAIIKTELDVLKIPYTKLTAKTIDFSDLARAACVFVTIHGWESGYESPARYKHLRELAVKNGFRIEVTLGKYPVLQTCNALELPKDEKQ